MAPLSTVVESADALTALLTTYYSRFPHLNYPTKAYYARQHLMAEDTGVVGDHSTFVADSELIGRQAFLLDEPLRQALDGRIIRLPLDKTNCHRDSAHSRGESAVWGFIEDEPLSAHGWGLAQDTEDLEETRKLYTTKSMGMWLPSAPEASVTQAESVSAMDTAVVALQEHPHVGEPRPEGLAEEMYRRYIDEEQCCELGG